MIVQSLHLRVLTHRDPLIEKDYAFSTVQSDCHVLNFSVYFELHDLCKFTNSKVVRNMESKEEFTD